MVKHTMLELSTAHLSDETLDALSMGAIDSVMVYDKTAGWLGTVGYFVAITGLEENLPFDLESCFRFAENRGADWIMFENDAETVSGLKTYD